MLDARCFMISTLRSQVGFAAAVAHARLRLSRLELIGGSGRTAGTVFKVPGIGVFFDTRKGSFRYKISLYIITYHVAIIVYHYVSLSISQYIMSLGDT